MEEKHGKTFMKRKEMNRWRKKRGKEKFLLGAKPISSNKVQN